MVLCRPSPIYNTGHSVWKTRAVLCKPSCPSFLPIFGKFVYVGRLPIQARERERGREREREREREGGRERERERGREGEREREREGEGERERERGREREREREREGEVRAHNCQ